MSAPLDFAALAVLVPAAAALAVLGLDLRQPQEGDERPTPRAAALSGLRLGSLAAISLVVLVLVVVGTTAVEAPPAARLRLDAFGVLAVSLLAFAGLLVLSLSLTHFGMARSRPAEPIALFLLSLSGMAAAVVANHLLVLLVAIELAWLPLVASIALDPRRLSSSESSLKAFFAHAFASIVFAHGIVFVFGGTGRLDLAALGVAEPARPLVLEVGLALVLVGLIARSVLAPFHPWSPDVHEGAPGFVTTHIATVAQIATFLVLLRLLHAFGPTAATEAFEGAADRPATLFATLGCLGLLWGHAMALVQVGLRRLVGWLGVGQAGFFALALVDARGEGGEALVLALIATSLATAGVFATLSSFSHHGRACEQVGDLSGMVARSPVRAALLALFLLSLGGFPGTVGFVARLRVLSAVDHVWDRWLLAAGLAATVLALGAVGRPLVAMLRPDDASRDAGRALSNEQFVLALCGLGVVYLGLAPEVGGVSLSSLLADWIRAALTSLRA